MYVHGHFISIVSLYFAYQQFNFHSVRFIVANCIDVENKMLTLSLFQFVGGLFGLKLAILLLVHHGIYRIRYRDTGVWLNHSGSPHSQKRTETLPAIPLFPSSHVVGPQFLRADTLLLSRFTYIYRAFGTLAEPQQHFGVP